MWWVREEEEKISMEGHLQAHRMMLMTWDNIEKHLNILYDN
jgi:hypothetical protein